MAEGRRAEIVAAARAILEEGGPDAVTMRAIAERLGIRAPSLYKHFADKEALEVALIAVGFEESAAAFEASLDGKSDPVAAVARAYRRWALDHPHLYRLMTERPLPRERLPVGLEERTARPILEAFGGRIDLARAAWGLAHGLASLELVGRFPADADVDAAWAVGIEALAAHPQGSKRPVRDRRAR